MRWLGWLCCSRALTRSGIVAKQGVQTAVFTPARLILSAGACRRPECRTQCWCGSARSTPHESCRTEAPHLPGSRSPVSARQQRQQLRSDVWPRGARRQPCRCSRAQRSQSAQARCTLPCIWCGRSRRRSCTHPAPPAPRRLARKADRSALLEGRRVGRQPAPCAALRRRPCSHPCASCGVRHGERRCTLDCTGAGSQARTTRSAQTARRRALHRQQASRR